MYELIYTNCFYDKCICKVCSNIIILLLFVEITPFFHGKREIVVDIGDNSITRSSMSTLLPGEWIDGDVIVAAYYAYYLELVNFKDDYNVILLSTNIYPTNVFTLFAIFDYVSDYKYVRRL